MYELFRKGMNSAVLLDRTEGSADITVEHLPGCMLVNCFGGGMISVDHFTYSESLSAFAAG